MDAIETIFKKELIAAIGSIKYEAFKKGSKGSEKSPIYEAALSTIRSINLSTNVNNDMLTLIKERITKLTLPMNKYRSFIFCGCYMLKGKKVVLLELSETVGTFYFEDSNIVRQLKNYKVGLKIGLQRHSTLANGVNLILPYEDNNIGLFENIV